MKELSYVTHAYINTQPYIKCRKEDVEDLLKGN
jgi:hypothetical protein